MSKDVMIPYRIFKFLLGGIYKWYYRPTFIGVENIPKEGPLIFVGNHKHIMDQNGPILCNKRPIHYMAKKEYFDDWKTAWFAKGVGCIPVDRKKKDTDAKEKAIEVLNNGHALGIFPEGTRNGIKEDKAKEIYNKYFFEMSYKSFYYHINLINILFEII